MYSSRPATCFRVHTCMYVCNNKPCRGHVVPSYLIHSCVEHAFTIIGDYMQELLQVML